MQEGIGESIGGLLQLLGMGLGSHGQQKLEQQQKQRTRQALEGLAPGYGAHLSQLSPEDRKVALGKVIRDPILDFLDNRSNELGGRNFGPDQGEGYIPGIGNFSSRGQNAGLAALGLIPSERESNEFPPSRGGEKAQQRQEGMRKSLFTPEQEAKLALKYPQLAALSQRERLHGEEQEFKTGEKRREEAFRETAKYREKVENQAAASSEDLGRLRAQYAINKKNNLPEPWVVATVEGLGLNVPAFLGADAETYQKLSADFIKNLKDVFGSQVRVAEMNAFLKTLPTLMNSPEGRDRLLTNMIRISEARIHAGDVMDRLLEENEDVPTLNLKRRVNKEIKPYMDNMWEQFVKTAAGENTGPKNATQARQSKRPKHVPENYVRTRRADGQLGWNNPDKLAEGEEVVG